jgi:hypothetical protein
MQCPSKPAGVQAEPRVPDQRQVADGERRTTRRGGLEPSPHLRRGRGAGAAVVERPTRRRGGPLPAQDGSAAGCGCRLRRPSPRRGRPRPCRWIRSAPRSGWSTLRHPQTWRSRARVRRARPARGAEGRQLRRHAAARGAVGAAAQGAATRRCAWCRSTRCSRSVRPRNHRGADFTGNGGTVEPAAGQPQSCRVPACAGRLRTRRRADRTRRAVPGPDLA